MKRKIAFIDMTNFKDWPMGGMLEYELAILNHLVEEYDVDIWGVSVDGKVNDSLLINGKQYPIHIFGNAKTKKRIIPNYWRGLELYLKRNEFPKYYDAIYAHTGSCVIAAEKIIDRSRTKIVYQQHGLSYLESHSLMTIIQKPAYNMAQKASDLVFVVSDEETVEKYAEEMKGKIKTNAHYVAVGSPLNLETFNEEAVRNRIAERNGTRAATFIYTGRLDAWKNVRALIDTMRIYVMECDSKAVLKLVGAGNEYDNLKNAIEEHHLEKNVQLLGAVPHNQVYELLQDSDIFVIASNGEGVSVSVLEAYASGLPVVCFNVPGLERQVIDGVTGVIAKERSVRGFYDAMVLADTNRTQLAYNCLEEAKRYDSRKIAGKIIEEINRIMSE